VLGFLKSLISEAPPAAAKPERAPEWVTVKGGFELPLAQHLTRHEGYPVVDWEKVRAWVEGLDESRRAAAWTACERAWLLHFRDALGSGFRLDESGTAALVSSLEPGVARATLEFMAKTERRIGAVLKGVVESSPWGKDILILFDDGETYYRYVSHYYPETGEFATSGGMHLNSGCSHFVSVKNELRALEAMIVHEMTHASLEHLSLPLWLNEGLAVNTERRLAGAAHQPLGALEKLHEKLRRFWSVVSIQTFWSGASFHRPGDSNPLSYELARILVEQLAADWEPFARFVREAKAEDAGAAAARECLGLDLGEAVTALLERDTPKSWSPDPEKWEKQ
jgi:hypothetical protein